MFSGFGTDFNANLRLFADQVKGNRRVCLLLQGGPGHEQFLNVYLEPLKSVGLESVSVIVPNLEKVGISAEQLEEISNSDGVFIGGGITKIYQSIYCRPEVRNVLQNLKNRDIPIAGLSAGAKILSSSVHVDRGERESGLGLISDIEIFPHFDEDGYARGAIDFCLSEENRKCLAIDTNCLLVVNSEGEMLHFGSGRAFWLESNMDEDGEIRVRLAF